MKRLVILSAAFLLSVAFVVPRVSFAQTATDIQSQINALLAEIQVLQGELPAQGGSVPAFCYTFASNLSIGQSGAAVTALQTALQKDGESVSVTGTFDDQTASAVTGFQEKYASAILAPYGLVNGTGYVGSATRAELNGLYGCGTTTPSSSVSSIQITAPTAGQVFSNGETMNVQWTPASGGVAVIDLVPTAGGPSYQIYGLKVDGDPTNYDGYFPYVVSGIPAGSYYVEAYSSLDSISDGAGVMGQSGAITVTAQANSTQEPSFSGSTASVSSGNSITFTWNVPTGESYAQPSFTMNPCPAGITMYDVTNGEAFLCGDLGRTVSWSGSDMIQFTNANATPVQMYGQLYFGVGQSLNYQFTVGAAPVPVTVTSPSAGQSFTQGERLNIEWTPASGGVAQIQLVSMSGGESPFVYSQKAFGDPVNYSGYYVADMVGIPAGSYYVRLINPENDNAAAPNVIGQSGVFSVTNGNGAQVMPTSSLSIANVSGLQSSYLPGQPISFTLDGVQLPGNQPASSAGGFNVQAYYSSNGGLSNTGENGAYNSNTGLWNVTLVAPSTAGAYNLSAVLYCGNSPCSAQYPLQSGAGQVSQNFNFTVSPNASSSANGPVPTVTFSANPTTITAGQQTMLTWSSANATYCTTSGGSSSANGAGWVGNGYPSQTVMQEPSVTTTYTVTCTGSGGTSSPASATVTVTAPVRQSSISASPTSLNFTAAQNGGNPNPQILNISGSNVSWSVGTSGGSWLYFTGTKYDNLNSGSISVYANQDGLSPGTYTGSVSLTCPGGCSATAPSIIIPVTLTVTPASAPVANPYDLNGDGVVNIVDFQILSNAVTGSNTTCGLKCDLNGDGLVNVVDLQKMINYLQGIGINPNATKNLSVVQNGSFGSGSLITNSTGVEIGSYVLTNPNAEAVNLPTVTIQAGQNANMLQNFRVMVNGAQFGTTQASLADNANVSISANGTPLVIPSNGSIIMNVYADVLSSGAPGSANTTGFVGCAAMGQSDNASYGCNSTTGQTMTVVALARPSISVTAGNVTTPAIVLMGTTNNLLATFNFAETSNQESVRITQLTVNDAVNAGQAQFNNLTLWNGSTELGSVGVPLAGTNNYTFQLQGNPIIVPQANSVLISLKGNAALYAAGATDSQTNVFSIPNASSVTALGVTSNQPATVTLSNPSGSSQTLLRTTLTPSVNNSSADGGYFAPSNHQSASVSDDLAEIKFSAANSGGAALTHLTVTFSGSLAASSNFLSGVQLLDSNDINVTSDGAAESMSSPCTGGSCTVTWTMPTTVSQAQIAVGSTGLFKLRINDMDGAAARAGVSLSLSATIQNAGDVQYYDSLSNSGSLITSIPSNLVPMNITSFALPIGAGGAAANPYDVNGDGVVNMLDYQTEQAAALGVSTACGLKCDLNGDGQVNVVDLQKMINYLLSIGISPTESASPSSLAFTVSAGSISSPSPSSASFAINNYLPNAGITVANAYTSPLPSGANWLSVGAMNGSGVTSVSVQPGNAPGGLAAGTYTASITVSAYGQTVTVPVTLTVTPVIAPAANIYDVNGDGVVNVADYQLVYNEALGVDTTCGLKCDLNGDGVVNVVDLQKMINYLLSIGINPNAQGWTPTSTSMATQPAVATAVGNESQLATVFLSLAGLIHSLSNMIK